MISIIVGMLIQIITVINSGTSDGSLEGEPGQTETPTGTTDPNYKPPGGTGAWDDNG